MINNSLAAVAAVLIAAFPWPGQTQASMPDSGAASQAVRTAYESLRDAMYNDEPLEKLESLYGQSLRVLEEAELPAGTQALWRSRIEYILARGYKSRSGETSARRHYEAGLAFAETALEQDPESEAWRMKSEHIGQLCLIKGLGFLLVNGRKVAAFAEKALQLDPRNAAAQIIAAASKIYPPPVFGGNPVGGIQLMQQALAMGTAERDDLFNIYSGIGLAYAKLKNEQAAREWLFKALVLYPGNVFVRREYDRACR